MPHLFRHPHEEDTRHLLDQHVPHPDGHPVRAGLAVVEVEDDGGQTDADRHQHHGEEEVAAQQGEREGGGRDDLDNYSQPSPSALATGARDQ